MDSNTKINLCSYAGIVIQKRMKASYFLADINIDDESILLKFRNFKDNSLIKCLIDIGITGNPRIEDHYIDETYHQL